MTEYKYYTGTSIKATTGLVAAYSPSKDTVQGGQLLDISGNGNHGTINGGAILTKDGMKFDGVDDKVTIGDIENVKTIALRVKLNSTSEKILEGQANDILVYSNAGTLSYSDFDNAYVNGVDSDTVVSGQWINVVITSSTDVDCSALTLALNNTTYGNLEISDVRFYSDEKDSDWAKAYHNSFITPQIIEDFQNYPVGDTSPKGFVQGTGSYEIKEGKDDFDTNSYHYPCSLSETGWLRCADNTGTNEGANGVGQALKEVGLGTGVGEGTDLVGFASKLSGYRYTNGSFSGLSSLALFWSSTSFDSAVAWRRELASSYSSIRRLSVSRAFGFYLRCLRDTNDTSDFTDPRDGNVYECVRIGNQVWMKRNLAYLPSVNTGIDGSEAEPKYYVYAYNGTDVPTAKASANYTNEGVLYNYDAAIISAPEGFHAPSDEEWNILERYVFEKIIGEKYRFLECTSNGTITIPLDLDSFTDNGYIEIDRFITNWQTHKGTVSDLNSESWFDYSNKKITLTATAGERFANIKIFNGVIQ
jgi:hypothetical protein